MQTVQDTLVNHLVFASVTSDNEKLNLVQFGNIFIVSDERFSFSFL